MNAKTTVVLLVLLALGIGALLLFGKAPEKAKEDAGPVFPGFLDSDVSALSWTLGTEKTSVRREGKGFQVHVGDSWVPASDAKVKELLADLGRTRYKGRIEAKDQKEGAYGLKPPAGRLEFTMRGETHSLAFGSDTVRKDTVYARRDGETAVLLVGNAAWETLTTMGGSAVRARKVVSTLTTIADLDHVEIQAGDKVTFSADRGKGAGGVFWKGTIPFQGYVDPHAVESKLLPTILALRVATFVADGVKDADLPKYGLAKPRYVVTVHRGRDADETISILVGAAVPDAPDESYFMQKGHPFVYAGKTKDLLEELAKDPASRRDHSVARFGWTKIDRIEVAWPGADFTAKLADKKWELDEPEKRTLDTDAVQKWLDAIRDLKAEKFLDDPDLGALGLDKPAGRIRLYAAAGDQAQDHGDEKKKKEGEEAAPIFDLLIGKAAADASGVNVYVAGGEKTAYVVGTALIDRLRTGFWQFVPSIIFRSAPDDSSVTGIARKGGGEDREILKKDDKWTPEGVDTVGVTSVVSHLLDLHAVRWLGAVEGHEKEYGLEAPGFLTLTATFEGDRKFGVIVGHQVEGGRYARAVRDGKVGEGAFVIAPADVAALRVPLTTEIFSAAPAANEATKVTVKAGEGEPKTFEHTENGWGADSEGVSALVSRLVGVRYTRRVGPAAGNEEAYGLGKALFAEVTVEFGKRSLGLELGKESGGGRYARAVVDGEPAPGVVVISDADVKVLTAPAK